MVKQTAVISVPHSPEHQQDADTRNEAFEQDGQRRLAEQQEQNIYLLTRNNLLIPMSLSISTSEVTHEKNMRDSLWRRGQELKNWVQLPDLLRQRKSSFFTSFSLPASVNISLISEVDFHYNLKDWNVEFRSISLYEIDRILEEQLKAKGQDNKQVAQELLQWHADYTDVLFKAASDILPIHRPHNHKIILEKKSNLRYSSLYKMTTEKLKAVKKYLKKNLHKGFIEPSQAPFTASVLFIWKGNSVLQFCIDYQKLNALTKKDQYLLSLIDKTLAWISQAKIFIKLDICQAFHCIHMDPESEKLTTFRTCYESYKCKVLPFDLTNESATYQRYINDVLFDYLDDFCTAYLDDILIYSDNELNHDAHVHKVLQRLQDADLQADIKKCEFSVKRIKYLGFIISTDGIEVDSEKISAVESWQLPKTVKGIQLFLGFCNFYCRFIHDYRKIVKSLVNLIKMNIPFSFNQVCTEVFQELMNKLTSASLLWHYNMNLSTMVKTDASDRVVAGILSQQHSDTEWYSVVYFLKTMTPAECNYEIHDKEMLAIICSLEQWRLELEGTHSQFQIYTDHKALEYFITTKQLTERQAWWAEALSEYYFTIMYWSDKQNTKADMLTQWEQETSLQNEVKAEYWTCAFLSCDQVNSWVLKNLRINVKEVDLVPMKELLIDKPLGLINRILQVNRMAESL